MVKLHFGVGADMWMTNCGGSTLQQRYPVRMSQETFLYGDGIVRQLLGVH